MVQKLTNNDFVLYQCEACGFHYEQRDWAEQCEAWCRKHHSCNIEFTARAVENKQ